MGEELAFLGGGCFWCLDAVFRPMKGVAAVDCGYMGGAHPAPDYPLVCSGTTGHAEVVRLRFDPSVVSYETLLAVFFAIHDPTQLNRQGHDVGTQYRSIILWNSEAQRETARHMLENLAHSGAFPDPVVTDLQQAGTFYLAESGHQDYFRQHPEQGYCSVVIAPKLIKFRNRYQSLLKDE